MRGKETLKQLEEKYHKYIIDWYYMSNMSKEERDRLYSMYDEEIKIIDNELAKYKKAFEILKDNCHISNYVVDGVNSGKKITFDVIREWYDKEEYELLEELMNNESR